MADLARILQEIMDIESVSGTERELADHVERLLAANPHLELHRDGDYSELRGPIWVAPSM